MRADLRTNRNIFIQEPTSEEYSENKNGIANSSDQISVNSGVTNSPESATPTSSLTSLIKVSSNFVKKESAEQQKNQLVTLKTL